MAQKLSMEDNRRMNRLMRHSAIISFALLIVPVVTFFMQGIPEALAFWVGISLTLNTAIDIPLRVPGTHFRIDFPLWNVIFRRREALLLRVVLAISLAPILLFMAILTLAYLLASITFRHVFLIPILLSRPHKKQAFEAYIAWRDLVENEADPEDIEKAERQMWTWARKKPVDPSIQRNEHARDEAIRAAGCIIRDLTFQSDALQQDSEGTLPDTSPAPN